MYRKLTISSKDAFNPNNPMKKKRANTMNSPFESANFCSFGIHAVAPILLLSRPKSVPRKKGLGCHAPTLSRERENCWACTRTGIRLRRRRHQRSRTRHPETRKSRDGLQRRSAKPRNSRASRLQSATRLAGASPSRSIFLPFLSHRPAHARHTSAARPSIRPRFVMSKSRSLKSVYFHPPGFQSTSRRDVCHYFPG